MTKRTIRVTGEPKPQINLDLLAQAILLIAQEQAAQADQLGGHDGDAA